MKRLEINKGRFLFWLLVIDLFFFYPFVVYAQDSGIKQQFERANFLYKESKYAQAIDAYETILQQGLESGNLYYNLGNSYFKQRALGKAILNYERAKQFIPQDSDAQANYEYAKSLLNLGAQEPSGPWFLKRLDRLSSGITVNLWTLFLAAVQAAFFLALIAAMLCNAPPRLYRVCLVIFIMLIVPGGLAFKRKIGLAQRSAIVVTKEIVSKFEPLESSTSHFTLTEGSKIEVIETSGEWCKIKRFDNKTGWVKRKGIEFVFQNESLP